MLRDVDCSAGGAVKNKIMQNEESDEELRKPIIRKFEEKKICLSFIDNTWGAHLVDMQLFSKFNKEIRFLLCVIYIYSNYA